MKNNHACRSYYWWQYDLFVDATEQFTERTTALFVYVENADETFKKALDEGATSLMLPADQSYGRSGGVKYLFGKYMVDHYRHCKQKKSYTIIFEAL